MKLYIGGAYQGQEEVARTENPEAEIISDFHLLLRDFEGNAQLFAEAFYEKYPDAVVVANEVGAGIVPMDPFERAYRERAGRAMCVLAQKSECVVRVLCGIGVRIK